MSYTENIIGNFDPTFLFIWRGHRTCDEINYHSHEHIEINLILSGTGRYLIDGQYYEVKEGDVLLFNPGVSHQSFVTNPNDPALEFFVGFSDVNFKGLGQNYFPFPENRVLLRSNGVLKQKLFQLSRSMMLENEQCHEGRYFMLKSYLMQMLLLLIREQTDPVKVQVLSTFESTSKAYVVEKLIDYFDEHYNEKISLDQVAENMYLSPFYLSRIFKSETGDSPIRYLINVRLEKAKNLLEEGWSGSIQEVASAVGYDDAYHFSKLFKKKFGVSPSRLSK